MDYIFQVVVDTIFNIMKETMSVGSHTFVNTSILFFKKTPTFKHTQRINKGDYIRLVPMNFRKHEQLTKTDFG